MRVQSKAQPHPPSGESQCSGLRTILNPRRRVKTLQKRSRQCIIEFPPESRTFSIFVYFFAMTKRVLLL
jgi:hypothetical protein